MSGTARDEATGGATESMEVRRARLEELRQRRREHRDAALQSLERLSQIAGGSARDQVEAEAEKTSGPATVSDQRVAEGTVEDRRGGYNTGEADDFIERVAIGVSDMNERLRTAMVQAEAAEARVVDLQRELDAVRRHPVSAEVPETPDEQLRRTLVLAHRTAEATIKEAKEEATRVLSEAREEAARIRGHVSGVERQAVQAEKLVGVLETASGLQAVGDDAGAEQVLREGERMLADLFGRLQLGVDPVATTERASDDSRAQRSDEAQSSRGDEAQSSRPQARR